MEGTGSVGLSFFKAESRPMSKRSDEASTMDSTLAWFSHQEGLCSETPSNAACFPHCSAQSIFQKGRHLYLRGDN